MGRFAAIAPRVANDTEMIVAAITRTMRTRLTSTPRLAASASLVVAIVAGLLALADRLGIGLALGTVGFGAIATFITLYYASHQWSNAAFSLTLFGGLYGQSPGGDPAPSSSTTRAVRSSHCFCVRTSHQMSAGRTT